jgi:hypothetical protein
MDDDDGLNIDKQQPYKLLRNQHNNNGVGTSAEEYIEKPIDIYINAKRAALSSVYPLPSQSNIEHNMNVSMINIQQSAMPGRTSLARNMSLNENSGLVTSLANGNSCGSKFVNKLKLNFQNECKKSDDGQSVKLATSAACINPAKLIGHAKKEAQVITPTTQLLSSSSSSSSSSASSSSSVLFSSMNDSSLACASSSSSSNKQNQAHSFDVSGLSFSSLSSTSSSTFGGTCMPDNRDKSSGLSASTIVSHPQQKFKHTTNEDAVIERTRDEYFSPANNQNETNNDADSMCNLSKLKIQQEEQEFSNLLNECRNWIQVI